LAHHREGEEIAMTKFELKLQAAEHFVRDVLKRKVSERVIKEVAKKVARATPTVQEKSREPERKRA
jgi:hypothetical protein